MNANAVIEHEPTSTPVKIINADAGSLMAVISRAIADPTFDVDKLERILTTTLPVYERMKAHEARLAFDEAVAAAKAEITIIGKNRTGNNSKRYADFAAYAAVLDPIISRHGIRYKFQSRQDQAGIHVTCVLSGHGHSEENTLTGPVDATGNKNAVQAIGSTLTYLQRYCLVQAFGLAASEDDNGQAAGAALGDTGPITAEQLAELRSLIVEVAIDIGKVLARASALAGEVLDRLDDIPQRYFAQIAGELRQRHKKAGAPA